MVYDASAEELQEIERIVDSEGFVRDEERWRPGGEAKLYRLSEALRAAGFGLKFEPDDDRPFNLQCLHLMPETRSSLEHTESLRLDELAGFCPVQAEGEFDGIYFYFRARGSYWRFEAGGNATNSKGARWWHEECWPGPTGFEAGYMSDDDAIRCILKAIDLHRFSDRSRFEEGHRDYERTTLEGWFLGALSLPRVVKRLGTSGEEALKRLTAYGIERPYFADLELKALSTVPGKDQALDKVRGIWTDPADEDD